MCNYYTQSNTNFTEAQYKTHTYPVQNTHIPTYIHTYIHTHSPISCIHLDLVCVYIYVCMYVCMYICMCFVCVMCMSVCVYSVSVELMGTWEQLDV